MRLICIISLPNLVVLNSPFWAAMRAAVKFVNRDIRACARQKHEDGNEQSGGLYQQLTFHKLEESVRPKLHYLVFTCLACGVYQSFPITTHAHDPSAQGNSVQAAFLFTVWNVRMLRMSTYPHEQSSCQNICIPSENASSRTSLAGLSSLPYSATLGPALPPPPLVLSRSRVRVDPWPLTRAPPTRAHRPAPTDPRPLIDGPAPVTKQSLSTKLHDGCIMVASRDGTQSHIFGTNDEIKNCIETLKWLSILSNWQAVSTFYLGTVAALAVVTIGRAHPIVPRLAHRADRSNEAAGQPCQTSLGSTEMQHLDGSADEVHGAPPTQQPSGTNAWSPSRVYTSILHTCMLPRARPIRYMLGAVLGLVGPWSVAASYTWRWHFIHHPARMIHCFVGTIGTIGTIEDAPQDDALLHQCLTWETIAGWVSAGVLAIISVPTFSVLCGRAFEVGGLSYQLHGATDNRRQRSEFIRLVSDVPTRRQRGELAARFFTISPRGRSLSWFSSIGEGSGGRMLASQRGRQPNADGELELARIVGVSKSFPAEHANEMGAIEAGASQGFTITYVPARTFGRESERTYHFSLPAADQPSPQGYTDDCTLARFVERLQEAIDEGAGRRNQAEGKFAASHDIMVGDFELAARGICYILGVDEHQVQATIRNPDTAEQVAEADRRFAEIVRLARLDESDLVLKVRRVRGELDRIAREPASSHDVSVRSRQVTVTEAARDRLSAEQRRTLEKVRAGEEPYTGVRDVLTKWGVQAICNEVYEHGEPEDIDCLHYILFESCGTSQRTFDNSSFPMDCTQPPPGRMDSVLHADRRRADGQPMRFMDFVMHEKSRPLGKSDELPAYVLALRLYTTALFKRLNQPFYMSADGKTPYSQMAGFEGKVPIPIHGGGKYKFRVTLYLICQALSRARANERRTRATSVAMEASQAATPQLDPSARSTSAAAGPNGELPRGLCGLRSERGQQRVQRGRMATVVTKELWRGIHQTRATTEFFDNGGTHVGPLSTTEDLDIALRYAHKRGQSDGLLLKIMTRALHVGINLSYLSCFPEEKEFLYPPCTCARPSTQGCTLCALMPFLFLS